MLDDFRLRLAFRMTQYTVAVLKISVQLHIADGGEAVEPCVGRFFHHLFENRDA